MKYLAFSLLLALGTCCAADRERELVFVSTEGAAMPIAENVNGVVANGIVRDLGDAIGAELGRTVRYLAMPRKRMLVMLESGEADGFCYGRPEWYGDEFINWSKPLVSSKNLVVASASTQRSPQRLSELAGVKLGTVLGYRYPELESTLGTQFVRDDAPTAELNFAKLSAGRVQYAVVDSLALGWRLKLGDPPLKLHPQPLVVSSFVTRCGFSKRSAIPFADVERAIERALTPAKLEAILAKYR